VGYTPKWRFKTRMKEHFSGDGSRWCKRHGVESLVWTKDYSSESFCRVQEDVECSKILQEPGWNSCRGGLFNLAKDVSEMPSWIVRPYFEHKNAIDEAEGRGPSPEPSAEPTGSASLRLANRDAVAACG